MAIDGIGSSLSLLTVSSAGQVVWELPGPSSVLYVSTEEMLAQTTHFTVNKTAKATCN